MINFSKQPGMPTLPKTFIFKTQSALPELEGTKSPFKLEKVSRLCRKHRRGAAAVEFAIIAPLFFLLILGMIEIGRAVMVQQIITNASREGARLAVLPGENNTNVVNRVNEILTDSGVNGARTEIFTETDSPLNIQDIGYGDVVKVKVTVPFSAVSWLPGADKYMVGKDLTAVTVMRGERVQ
jgi:Flp pilus assembly protein TadG